jgi:SSS family transporter
MNDAPHTAGLETIDYLAVIGYLAITWWIAYRATRKTDDTEDFFLGGRTMPWFVVGLSIMATLLSTNTYLGAPGEMIKNGPAYFIGYLAYPVIYFVVAKLWIPFFMRLRLTSAYEYLERRFNYSARLLGNSLFLLMRLGWMSMVVYTASLAMAAMVPGPLQQVADWIRPGLHPIYPVIAAVGIAATIYACVGGIQAVIWTDVLQSVMLFGGVFVIILHIMWSEGTMPTQWWAAVTNAGHDAPQLHWHADFDVTHRTTVLWAFFSILAWSCCTHCCDQVALQRYFTTTSAAAAKRSFIVSLVSSGLIGLLLAISGLGLRYYFMRHAGELSGGMTATSGADQLMPLFFANVLPAGFGGLILVSFLCDALQTLGSGVNSIAAIVTSDAERKETRSTAGNMWFARVITLVTGALTTGLAIGAAVYALHLNKSIFDMLPPMFNMFLAPLAILFMIGMFYRRATAAVAIGTVFVTQIFSTLWSWWAEVPSLLRGAGLEGAAVWFTSILGVTAEGKMKTPSVMLAIFAPALFGLVAGAVASALFGRDDHPGLAYTRREVMKRPEPQPTA